MPRDRRQLPGHELPRLAPVFQQDFIASHDLVKRGNPCFFGMSIHNRFSTIDLCVSPFGQKKAAWTKRGRLTLVHILCLLGENPQGSFPHFPLWPLSNFEIVIGIHEISESGLVENATLVKS
jgi:hypothetical protein